MHRSLLSTVLIVVASGIGITGSALAQGSLTAEELTFPSGEGGRFPSVSLGADGKTYTSWIASTEAGGAALRFVQIGIDGEISQARTIAEGDDWFVNWADFPSIVALADGSLAAHWLQRLGGGRYAYGVRVSCSSDGGETWLEPFWLHEDRSSAEHGFATLVPGEGRFEAVWLDGRDMKSTGSMTLRGRSFDSKGELTDDRLLDPMVCDCCATDAVFAQGEFIAVYRDRSDGEIRDISRLRRSKDSWGEPDTYPDLWHTPG
jgi:hypothetical protein